MDVINCPEAKDDIKRMFRAGKIRESSNKPRPIIVSFNSIAQREQILSNAKLLADSEHKHVSIQPDLTKGQQNEENRLYDEAKKKNNEMDDDDAKNWIWRPWGVPGSKTLRKMEHQSQPNSKHEHKKKD